MDTIKFKHFCTVVETESLTKASELLGITHAGLHKSLKSLEDQLNILLTEPKGRGITITLQGREAYPLMKEIIAKVDNLVESTRVAERAVLRMGATEPFCLTLPQRIYAQRLKSDLSLSFHERCPGELEPQIAENQLSFGLTTFPISHSGVEHLKIASIPLGLFASSKLKFSDDLTFIRPNSVFDFRERDHWREELFSRKKVIKVNMLSTGLEMAIHNHGAIFVPKFLVKHINQRNNSRYELKEITLPQELSVTIPLYLVHRTTESRSLALEQILKVVMRSIEIN